MLDWKTQPCQTVFVSVLNWNSAITTIACLRAALSSVTESFIVRFVVLDNGSEFEDWTQLRQGLAGCNIEFIRLEQNVGFAAGHNAVIRLAMKANADFVWLLNNDAIVTHDALASLVSFMRENPECGAVSPVIYALHDKNVIDFCGAMHDWRKLDSVRPNTREEARLLEAAFPLEMWVHGTAPLYRLSALSNIGLLDERMFAYFEDDDIGVRLSLGGWTSRMAYEAEIQHARGKSYIEERPPYFFYLMTRNSLLFWVRYAKKPHRRLIRLRLFSRAMLLAAKLRERGFKEKSNACLLGALDGALGRSGIPRLNVPAPNWLVLASRLLPYRVQKLLD